ncbi:hypothetical protein D3C71_1324450 [compost metagenome]
MVFKHDDAVEQTLATLPGPALDVGQRRVFVVAHGQVVILQLTQPLAQRLLRVEGLDHRQGVDEQAEHFLGTGQTGRAPRHCRAEGHAALSAVALQQQQPGTLHQGVEGHALTLGETVQLACRLGIEVAVHHAMTGARGTRGLGQNGRGLQQRQALAPETFGLGIVLTLQPGDVIGVATGQRRQAVVVVQAQHLAEQTRSTPAVQQQVMVDPDHLVTLFTQANQDEAHQRRAAQVEAFGLLGSRQFAQCLFGVTALTPVEFFDRQLNLGKHRLQRIGQTIAPAERRAQHFMTLDQRLPCRAETRHLQAIHGHAQLVDVGVELR